ncbi:MAG: hypothetical protein LBM68_04780 [Bacteroidales bacterium]|jgi:antitoxin component YwqK of YwqJK toxin-antitoxin module|nr:hypothetical protein [Bacteroidales bacterium]
MKYIFSSIFYLCCIGSLYAQNQTIELHTLQKIGDVYMFNEKPYTGIVYEKHENGSIGLVGELQNGKRENVWTYWYSTGVKKRETTYINNKKEGSSYYWHTNGTLAKEVTFRTNQNIDQKLWNNSSARLKNPQFEIFK